MCHRFTVQGSFIECTTMAQRYLGETFDIHAGGEDLIFPHHECEIAQAESLTGKPFSNYWVHTRFLQIEGEKMSKSTGNFVEPIAFAEQYGVDLTEVTGTGANGMITKPDVERLIQE